jgi:hypothetical protein
LVTTPPDTQLALTTSSVACFGYVADGQPGVGALAAPCRVTPAAGKHDRASSSEQQFWTMPSTPWAQLVSLHAPGAGALLHASPAGWLAHVACDAVPVVRVTGMLIVSNRDPLGWHAAERL